MKWNFPRRFRWFKRGNIPVWKKDRVRLLLEQLETRLAPAVDVLSFHNDQIRSGAQLNETILTPQNVNAADFGKLFSYPLDGYTYAQPLYKSNLTMADGSVHNVVFAATEHDTVYALDANNPNPSTGGGVLWQTSFINLGAGVTPVPTQDVLTQDIVPEIGITGTPAIDASTGTLYVVAKTKETSEIDPFAHYVQRLYALGIASGAKKASVVIGDTTFANGQYTNNTDIVVAGVGDGTVNGQVAFNALRELQRAGLALANGNVYVAFGSHGDQFPYHGWLVGYDEHDLHKVSQFNATPDGAEAGIWQAGGAPAVDQQGNIYLATGNGSFAAYSPVGPSGGGLGYGPDQPGGPPGIQDSLAVKFDLFGNTTDPSEGNNSTGVFTGGRSPTSRQSGLPTNLPDASVPLDPNVINLHSGHNFSVTLAYDSTLKTLTETISDQDVTLAGGGHPTFTKVYANVDLSSLVGGPTAYVGFTGGNGELTATQDITSWTLTNAAGTVVNHSTGFAITNDLATYGSARLTGTAARLTDGGANEAGSVFYKTLVSISGNFSNTFTFKLTNANADGFTFIIQNDPANIPGSDYGDTVLKIAPDGQTVLDFFTPSNFQSLAQLNQDLGSGATMLFDLPGTPGHGPWHLAVQTGKMIGRAYLIDRDNMGKLTPVGPDGNLQTLPLGNPGGVWASPAFWNNNIYYAGTSNPVQEVEVYFDSTPVAGYPNGRPQIRLLSKVSPTSFGFPGAQPVVSSNGLTNGILWAVQTDGFRTRNPEILHAYVATDLSNEIYNSNQSGLRDVMGGAVKFVTPTLANGHVYVGAEYELDVFGLLQKPSTDLGPIFVVHADNSLSENTDPVTSSLLMPGGAQTVSAGPGGGVFVIKSDQSLVQQTTQGWTQLAGAGLALSISAGGDTSGQAIVFAIGTDHSLWQHDLLGWHQLASPGLAKAVSAGPAGTVFAIGTDKSIWEHDSLGWHQLASAGLALAFSGGSDGSGKPLVDAIGTDNSLWQYTVTGWNQLRAPGLAQSISAGSAGTIFTTEPDNSLWEHDASGWTELDPKGTPNGPALLLNGTSNTSGQAVVLVVAQDKSLWEHTGSGWIEWAAPGTVQGISTSM